MANTDALAKVPMFQDLPKKALERLDRITRERRFKAGDVIFKEGDEGVGFFMISDGAVDISRGGKSLSTLKSGDFFGEMALLDNHRRSATVTASQDTTCLAMMRSDFLAELRANPDISLEVLASLSKRLRELDQRLAES